VAVEGSSAMLEREGDRVVLEGFWSEDMGFQMEAVDALKDEP